MDTKAEKEPSPEDKARGQRITARRVAMGLSTPALAKKLGVSHQALQKWEKGHGFSAKNAQRLSQILQIQLLPPLTEEGNPATLTNVRFEPSVQLPDIAALPIDVPVLGTAVGGSEGDFRFNGAVVNYVKRPPGIARARSAYAIRLVGTSMEPWGGPGTLLYADPDQPAADGDYVVLQMADAEDGGAGTAMVKRLIGRTPTQLKLGQYNPRKEFTIPRDKVASMHRLLPLSELLA